MYVANASCIRAWPSHPLHRYLRLPRSPLRAPRRLHPLLLPRLTLEYILPVPGVQQRRVIYITLCPNLYGRSDLCAHRHLLHLSLSRERHHSTVTASFISVPPTDRVIGGFSHINSLLPALHVLDIREPHSCATSLSLCQMWRLAEALSTSSAQELISSDRPSRHSRGNGYAWLCA